MNMKKIQGEYVTHFFVILFFIGISIVYMAPIVLEKKELVQPDIVNATAWGKDLRDYHRQTGEHAYWSNSMFGGMPHNYTATPPMPNLFRYIEGALFAVCPGNIALLILMMTGFYIFMISLGCKPAISMIGAIAYTFASFNIISLGAGHFHKVLVMSTMAPIIGGIILCYRKKYLWGAIITLVFSGLNVYWSHPQITYYLLITILILVFVYLYFAIQEKTFNDFLKSSAVLFVVALLAIAPDAGKLISTMNYTQETMRGGAVLQNNPEGKKENSGLDIDYAFQWSYGKGETMTMLIPNFYGASSNYNIGENSAIYDFYRKVGANANQAALASKYAQMYWGDQPFTSGPVYMGAIICFLFVLGLLILKGREKWWLLIATVIAIILSWGRHFPAINEFVFYHLPLYNKFRNPSMSLVVVQLTMATMAVLTLKEILKEGGSRGNLDKYLKPLYISAGITGGLCLIYALFGSGLMSFSGMADVQIQSPEMLAAIVSDRKSMLSADAWRSLLLIALAAGALWYYLRHNVKLVYVTALIGVLVFFDLWTVDKRFMNFDSFVPQKAAYEIPPKEVDLQILLDKDPHYRVFNRTVSTFNDATTSNFHKSIGGYSPVKLRRYQDIIDYHLAGRPTMQVLNMLNTKYVISFNQQNQQVAYINSGALGNVWFVNELKWVASPDEEIVALGDFNPAQTAIIDKTWESSLKGWQSLQHEEPDSASFIRLKNYANPGNLFYESSSSRPQLAVFSEVYYKTWRAYINGVEAPLVRVNYILRGLQVPAGNHQIELRCIDEVFLRGTKISTITSIFVGIILLLLLGYAALTEYKVDKKQ